MVGRSVTEFNDWLLKKRGVFFMIPLLNVDCSDIIQSISFCCMSGNWKAIDAKAYSPANFGVKRDEWMGECETWWVLMRGIKCWINKQVTWQDSSIAIPIISRIIRSNCVLIWPAAPSIGYDAGITQGWRQILKSILAHRSESMESLFEFIADSYKIIQHTFSIRSCDADSPVSSQRIKVKVPYWYFHFPGFKIYRGHIGIHC